MSPRQYVGRKPRLTPEQYARVRQVKAQRDAIPSDKQLACELGVSYGTVKSALHRTVKRYETQRVKEAER